MKIIGTMRLWNQRHIIREILERNLDVFDDIIVLDTGSTDGTWDIVKSLGLRHCYRLESSGIRQVMERKTLLSMARSLKPDWIVIIDSDEILFPLHQEMREELAALPEAADAAALPVLDFYFNLEDPEPEVTDGHPSIFDSRKYLHRANRWGTRFARPSAGIDVSTTYSNYREQAFLHSAAILHYGHCINRAAMAEKKARYLESISWRKEEGLDTTWIDKYCRIDWFAVGGSFITLRQVLDNPSILERWDDLNTPPAIDPAARSA